MYKLNKGSICVKKTDLFNVNMQLYGWQSRLVCLVETGMLWIMSNGDVDLVVLCSEEQAGTLVCCTCTLFLFQALLW